MAIKNATFSVNNGVKTATITKADNGDNTVTYLQNGTGENQISETTLTSLTTNGGYTDDINIIDASKLGAKANLIVDTTVSLAHTLTSIAGGKGADTFHLEGRTDAITLTGGAGKDNFIIPTVSSAVAGITITDYTSNQDTIQAEAINGYELVGRDVTVSLNDSALVTLKDAKDKLITFVNAAGEVLSEQSFQVGGANEYDITNANTGSIVTTGAKYVDGTQRSKPVTIKLTGLGADTTQTVDGGKGADTIIASAGSASGKNSYLIAGGKGNDTFVINSDTRVTITDYTLGGKEKIVMGAGLGYIGHDVDGNDVILSFSDTTDDPSTVLLSTYTPSATVRIKNGMWNQTTAEKKSYIALVDQNGNAVKDLAGKEFPQALANPVVRYVTKVDKKNNSFNLGTAQYLGADFPVDSDTYEAITFTPATPVAITIGGGYASITTGKGKDTIIGNNTPYDADDTSAPVKTKYLNSGSFVYDKYTGKTNGYYFVYEAKFTYGSVYLWFGAEKNGQVEVGTDSNGDPIIKDAYSIVSVFAADTDEVNGETIPTPLKNSDGTDQKYTKDDITAAGNMINVGVNTMVIPTNVWTIKEALYADTSDITELGGQIGTKIIEAAGGKGIEYSYTYNPSNTIINAGAGNDYIYSKNGGGNFFGDAGNDTLRGGNGGGTTSASTLSGGAGNDVFLLTGEGKDLIADYNSGSMTQAEAADATNGKKSNANRKKLLGADKLVVAWDKYAAKNTTLAARAEITGSTYNEDTGTLDIDITGHEWVAPETLTAGKGSAAAAYATVVGHFAGDGSNSYFSTYAGAWDTYEEKGDYSSKSTYSIKVKEGDLINVTEQGIVYSQYVNFGTNASEAKVGTAFTQNYNGLLNEKVKLIDATGSKKNSRLVAGELAATVIGGTKNDTLVGNGAATLTGGTGNDVFIVKSGLEVNGIGDHITDYSAGKSGSVNNGKDKVQVTDIRGLAYQASTPINDSAYTVTSDAEAKTITLSLKDSEGGDNGTITITVDGTTGDVAVVGISYSAYADYDLGLGAGDIIELGSGILGGTGANTAIKSQLGTLTYTLYEDVEPSENTYDTTTSTLKIGGIAFDNYTKGTAITFQQIDENPTYNAKKGLFTGSKKVTQTMIRAFGDDTIVSTGASNYFETFDGVDDKVKVIKAGSKAVEIKNGASNVNSIAGSAKADTIYAVADYEQTVSLKTGKGNDIIVWNGSGDIVVEDFTGTKYNKAGTKMTAGDIILLSDLSEGYLSQNNLVTTWDGNDVMLTAQFQVEDDEGNELTMTGGTITLKNAKGLAISVASDTSALTALAAASGAATVDATNPHEILLGAKDSFSPSQVNIYNSASSKTENATEDNDTWIVNASATTAKFPQNINLRTNGDSAIYASNHVQTVYGGKGADTVYAGQALYTVDLGAGNDIIFTGKAEDLDVTTGAGNDVLVLESDTGSVYINDYTTTADKIYLDANVKISGASYGDGQVKDITNKKGVVTGTQAYSDVTLSLANGGDVTFVDLLPGAKITRISGDNPGAKSLLYYSLDYVTRGQTTIDSKDYNKGAIIDLEGVNSSDVFVVKAAKNVAIKSGAGRKVSVAEDSKNAITYYGGSTAGQYYGAAGADVYYGAGKQDTVVLGAGNDTIRQASGLTITVADGKATGGNAASVVSGQGNNVFVVERGDNYSITGLQTNDKLALASVEGAAVDSVAYDSDTKVLSIGYSVPYTANNTSSTDTGVVTLKNYTAGNLVNISKINVNSKGKESLSDLLVRGYGAAALKLADNASANITLSAATDEYTTSVDASERKKAINIVDNKGVTSIAGGAGNDTIQSISENLTVTTGNGKDVVIVDTTKNTNVTVTDYAAGDVIQIANSGTDSFFSSLTDYDKRVGFDGKDLVFNDVIGTSSKIITLKDAVGKAVSIKVGDTTNTITYSDPVDVKLTTKNAANSLNWGTSESTFDVARVKTFDGSAASASQKITFITGETSDLTKFTGGKSADEFTDSRTGSNLTGLTVDLGAGGGTAVLNTSASADTITHSGGAVTVTNFKGTTEGDKISGVQTSDIKSATYSNDNNGTISLTLKKGSLAISGGDNAFTITYDNFKATTTRGEGDASDTTTFTFDKVVTINGIGNYTYASGTTNGYYKTADEAKAATGDSSRIPTNFEERFSDFAELVDDYVAPDTNDLADITKAKADISADDFKVGSTAETDFTSKITSASALSTNKKQE